MLVDIVPPIIQREKTVNTKNNSRSIIIHYYLFVIYLLFICYLFVIIYLLFICYYLFVIIYLLFVLSLPQIKLDFSG